MRSLVSPIDCPHTKPLLIQSGRGGPPFRSEHVTVCPACGQFRVSAEQNGIHTVVTFDLPSWRLVRAASRYVRYLAGEERVDHDAVARDLWYRWITKEHGDREVIRTIAEMDPIDAAVVMIRLYDYADELGLGSIRAELEKRSDRVRGITT